MERAYTQSRAERLFCVAFFAVAFYLAAKYALGVILPFAAGWLVSLMVVPLSRLTARKTGIPRGVCAAVYLTVLLISLGSVLYLLARRMVSELSSLIERLGDPESDIYATASVMVSRLEAIWERFSFIDVLLDKISSGGEDGGSFGVGDIVGGMVSALAQRLPSYLAGIIARAPSFLLSMAVAVMSCFYFSMDGERIGRGIEELIPRRHRSGIARLRYIVSGAMKRYARAYLLLMAITFIQIFVGLMILGVRFAFLLALVIALIDILPVLGTGTVLIPWSIIAFMTDNSRLGIGLIILYGVVTVIRQLIEPRLIGSSIGIHPVITLFSMYAGLRLIGVWGMILGPAAVLIAKEIMNGGRAPNANDISVESGS